MREEKRKRITASGVGQIASAKVTATVTQLLYSTLAGIKATNWRLLQEDVSQSEYLKKDSPDSTITSSRLVISMAGSKP